LQAPYCALAGKATSVAVRFGGWDADRGRLHATASISRRWLALQEIRSGKEQSEDMSDRPEGTVADAGEAVQQKINQAGEAHDQIETFIRDNPMTAVLIAVGIGYVLGKIA
jgi:ElaB/YqjD/DUF883 family membrane-anchored ribosome-binding protein